MQYEIIMALFGFMQQTRMKLSMHLIVGAMLLVFPAIAQVSREKRAITQNHAIYSTFQPHYNYINGKVVNPIFQA